MSHLAARRSRRSTLATLGGLVGAALAAIALPACAGIPSWVSNPPRDSEAFMYGVGEAPSLDQARQNALRSVAAGLRSAIAGKVERSITESRQNNSADVKVIASTTVSEEVLKTEFSRYEVERSERSDGTTFALVKVDRPAFIRDTRDQLAVLDQSIAPVERSLRTAAPFDQFMSLRRISPQVDKALTLSQLLLGASASTEPDGRAGVLRFGGLQQQYKRAAKEMSFGLRAQPADADIAGALATFLSDQGMSSSPQAVPGQPVMTIQTQSRQDEIYGNKMVKLKIHLAVLDGSGRAVAKRDYDVAAGSRYDFAGARQNAIVKLADQLKEIGSLEALGFAP